MNPYDEMPVVCLSLTFLVTHKPSVRLTYPLHGRQPWMLPIAVFSVAAMHCGDGMFYWRTNAKAMLALGIAENHGCSYELVILRALPVMGLWCKVCTDGGAG